MLPTFFYQFEYSGTSQPLLLVRALLPNFLGPWIAGAALLLTLVYWVRPSKSSGEMGDRFILIVSSLFLLGTFLFSARYLDEVFINLEHTYNAYHHGGFSFSPQKMIDGTVEFVYYLLLIPFAVNQAWLVRGNLIVGFIIAWLHLFILWKWVPKKQGEWKLWGLAVFSLAYPLIEILASGFGAGMVSLVFLLGLYLLLNKKTVLGLSCACILPLLRPDAILYGLVLLLLDFILSHKVKWIPVLILLSCSAFYFGLVRIIYGHWVPTCMAFKMGMAHGFVWNKFLKIVLAAGVIGGMGFGIISLFRKRQNAAKGISLLLLPVAGLLSLWGWRLLVPNYSTVRYLVGFEMLLVLVPILFACGSPCAVKNKILKTSFVLLSLFMIFWMAAHEKIVKKDHERTRIDGLGAGGQIVDAILPPAWKVAATELNTFGFMNDREMIDLFGFTTPDIAHSKLFNHRGYKVNPAFIEKARPEVIWLYTLSKKSEPIEYPYQNPDVENVLATWRIINQYWNVLGDMEKIVGRYHLVYLHTQEWLSVLFVRKDVFPELAPRLEEKPYKLLGSREIDIQKFETYYEGFVVS